MSTVKKGLGRGFDSLIPQGVDTAVLFEDQEHIQKIPVEDLVPNPHQPRSAFDLDALNSLADSIKRYGIVQPLVVTPHNKGKYALVAGERRWRAAQIAGLKKVPVVVRTTKELEQLEIALVENVQRVDLPLLDQAASIERLHQQFSMTYESIAKRLGKAGSTINNVVRLLQLSKEAQSALNNGLIYEAHARAILALKGSANKQAELLANILRHGWSVRQAEQFVTSFKQGFKAAKATHERMQTETPGTKQLSQQLGGTPVHIRRMAKGGKLEISFKTDEDLARILQFLSLD